LSIQVELFLDLLSPNINRFMVLCEYLDRNDGSSIFLPGYLERTSVLDFSKLGLPDKRIILFACKIQVGIR